MMALMGDEAGAAGERTAGTGTDTGSGNGNGNGKRGPGTGLAGTTRAGTVRTVVLAPSRSPRRRTLPGTTAVPGILAGPGDRRAAWLPLVVTVGLVVAALNLRPAVTSLGALLAEVRSGLGMSATAAGLLTSVPSLCFAVFGVAAPRLARRFGTTAVLAAGMAAVTAGLAVRAAAGGTAAFLAVSALALAGIAVSNVLMPVIVARWFPGRVGPMTGLYTMALATGTALGAGFTVPLTSAFGGNWRTGLGMWAAMAAVAVVPWFVVALRDRTPRPGSGRTPGRTAESPVGRIVRSPTAWALAVFFGLQSTGAYITMGWLPQIFRDAGMPASAAGVLLAMTMALGIPLSFAIPAVAGRLRSQGPMVVALGVFGIAGYTGLALAPASAPWLWAMLIGVSNCAFPLALTMIGMRARTGAGMVRLSAFAQCTGYVISIPGPIVVGALYEYSGGWRLPIALIAGLLVPQIAAGLLAGRDRHVEDELRRAPG